MRTVSQKNGEAGSALVEFALALVVILTLLFGVIDMGRALYAYDWVANAARIGTRYAMVRGTSCSTLLSGCRTGPPIGATQADVQAFIKSSGVGINTDPSALVITAVCDVGASVFEPLPCAPGQAVIVHVTYTFGFILPFIPKSPPTWHMASHSVRTVSQ
jgi:TadE-like protein